MGMPYIILAAVNINSRMSEIGSGYILYSLEWLQIFFLKGE